MFNIPLMNVINFSIDYLLIFNRITFIIRFTITPITNNYPTISLISIINTKISKSLTGFTNYLITTFGIFTNIEQIQFLEHRFLSKLLRNIGLWLAFDYCSGVGINRCA